MSLNLALLGCGKMGSALLNAWLEVPDITHIDVLDPHAPHIKNDKVTFYSNAASFNQNVQNIDVLLIAVKPQSMDEACPAIAPSVGKNTLVLSIAAGKTLENFARHFHKDQPAVRIMSNTPAAIGQGMSVAMASTTVTNAQKHSVEILLGTTGKLEWIEDETKFNALGSLSGSGPAYVFWLIEVLTNAGIANGLEPSFAARLARQTVIGSAALAAHEPDTDIEILRKNVTSPNGITEAALKILMNGDMQKLFDDALAAATKRGKELGA